MKKKLKKSELLDFKKIKFEKVSFKYKNSSKYNLQDLNIEISVEI